MSRKPGSGKLLPILLGGGLVLAAAVCVWLLKGYLDAVPPATKKVVQEIQVIRPPPPPETPPPPPPPEEELDVQDPLPEDQPEPTPSDEPPPGEQLGVDAEGTGAGDGFGLVGRKGGRDLLATGGSAFTWYAGLVKDRIIDALEDEQAARRGSYSVMVKVWVRPDGTVTQARLATSTGDTDRDRIIENALQRLGSIGQAPPPNLPQPINLRIVSRV